MRQKRGWRVWFNYASGAGWLVAGILAYPLGWAYSVAFVTAASIYANVKTDWGTAEAADDHMVLEAIAELKQSIEENRCQCNCSCGANQADATATPA